MPRKRHLDTYRLFEFLRPDGYWPTPYSLDQGFGLFRWMVETASQPAYIAKGRCGDHSPLSAMGMTSGIGHRDLTSHPITSIDDLRQRFQWAVFANPTGHPGEYMQRWRSENDITPVGQPRVSFPHYRWAKGPDSEAALQAKLCWLFARGKLGQQLNRFHPLSVHSRGVVIVPYAEGFTFQLLYGYADPGDSSRWGVVLAATKRGEAFTDTMLRAWATLQAIGLQAGTWATPTASDDQRGTTDYTDKDKSRKKGKSKVLSKDVALWATPVAADDGNKVTATSLQPGLIPQVANWPSPTARDHKGQDLPSRNGGHSLSHVAEQSSHPVLQPAMPGQPCLSDGPTLRLRLNPIFVNWLMGWPFHWTMPVPVNCGAAATESWRRRLHGLLSSLCAERLPGDQLELFG